MYKSKMQFICLFAAVLLLFNLTACGSKTSSDATSKKASAEASPVKAKSIKTPASTGESLEEETKAPQESMPAEAQQPTSEAVKTEEPNMSAETEAPVIQEPQIKDLNVTMYATRDLNVRAGDNKDTSLLGSLTAGQEVLVTGQSNSSGWYRIDYNGQAGFVSNKYLNEEKPVTQDVQSGEQQQEVQQAIQNEQNNVAKSGSVQQILDSAPLSPSKSGYEPLDTLLESLLPQLYSESAGTYEKVKACYDYLIQNCDYGMNERMMDYIDDYFWGGYTQQVSAYGMLLGHVGVCDDYSAAFTVMTREIGLDCRVVGGQTSKAGGGYTPHAWCVITINGTEYVFDPQVEDNIAKGGNIQYYRFCKRYDEVPDKYILQ